MSRFDYQTVHNLAAELFWQLADEIGVAQANADVIESGGLNLLSHHYRSDPREGVRLEHLAAADRDDFFKAVAGEAYEHSRDERNIMGSIYLEDATTGRAPSAAAIDTAPLNIIPRCTSAKALEKLGTLCLRHPLPAVVFSTELPLATIFEVENTQTALGFPLPMFMQMSAHQPVANGIHVLTGYFQIPVPSNAHGQAWSHVIQNSTRLIDGITAIGPDQQVRIAFEWPETDQTP